MAEIKDNGLKFLGRGKLVECLQLTHQIIEITKKTTSNIYFDFSVGPLVHFLIINHTVVCQPVICDT